MKSVELKSNLHLLVDNTDDIQILQKVMAYFKVLKEGRKEEWVLTDEELTRMAMYLSEKSLAEVWDNEEDEIWNAQ
jgi:hypothetical protein